MSDYEKLVNEVLAERKANTNAEAESLAAKRIRDKEESERINKVNADAEKLMVEQRNIQYRNNLVFGLDEEQIKDLDELINCTKQLSQGNAQYDPQERIKTHLQAKIDILKQRITEKGRNLGEITFIKKTYYESSKGDYFLFPDSNGKYGLYAGALGSFRTTNLYLQTDDNGHPLKTVEQGIIEGIPPIPINNYQAIVIKDKKIASRY